MNSIPLTPCPPIPGQVRYPDHVRPWTFLGVEPHRSRPTVTPSLFVVWRLRESPFTQSVRLPLPPPNVSFRLRSFFVTILNDFGHYVGECKRYDLCHTHTCVRVVTWCKHDGTLSHWTSSSPRTTVDKGTEFPWSVVSSRPTPYGL